VGVFTALLEGLTHCFPTYALVRNPLSVLASWNSVALPVRQGRLPMAERLDPSLRRMLRRRSDRFERQICLLGWFFGTRRYAVGASVLLPHRSRRAIMSSDEGERYADCVPEISVSGEREGGGAPGGLSGNPLGSPRDAHIAGGARAAGH
jgi:hypothetical protein